MTKGPAEAGWAYRSDAPVESPSPDHDAHTARPVRPRRVPTMGAAMDWISMPFQLMLVIGLAPFATRTRPHTAAPVE